MFCARPVLGPVSWALLLAAAAGTDVNSTYQCGRLDRVGPPSEGGKYVCGLETLRAGCVVYSFGISGDSRFESYLLQNTPCEVHAFDPTIAALPRGTHPKLRFEKVGLGLERPRHGGGLAKFSARYPTASLGALMARRGHTALDVLKVDVEGAEHEIFDAWCDEKHDEAMPTFDVLLIEVHARNSRRAWATRAGACLRHRGFRRFQAEQNLRGCACTVHGDVATELAWIRVDSPLARADSYDEERQEARHRNYLPVRRAALARLAQRKSPWRCDKGPAYFWDLFVPFHAGLAGEIAETRAETYDVAKRAFSRVAAAVEAVEAEGWRVVKKGILPGQCTSDARHKGSPGPVRARIVFARRAPARDS